MPALEGDLGKVCWEGRRKQVLSKETKVLRHWKRNKFELSRASREERIRLNCVSFTYWKKKKRVNLHSYRLENGVPLTS